MTCTSLRGQRGYAARGWLTINSQGLIDEHLAFLLDHGHELDTTTRRDVDRLATAVAGRLREQAQQAHPVEAGHSPDGARPSMAPMSPRDMEILFHVLEHPAVSFFMKIRTRLMSARERSSDPFLSMKVPDEVVASIEERAERDSLLGQSEALEAMLVSLDSIRNSPRAGLLMVRVSLLAELARHGRRNVEDVRGATDNAVRALEEVPDVLARAFLLREVAVVWSPPDHLGDPLHDFPRAVTLLRQCLELEGGESRAACDTISFLARALRYSGQGDLEENLRTSRRLFLLRLESSGQFDGPDQRANLIANLAEVESQMGTGSRPERLRVAADRYREAMETAKSVHRKAEYTANLAWLQTQIGFFSPGGERVPKLLEAMTTFERADVHLLTEAGRLNLEDNRTVCEAQLARLQKGRLAECEIWRHRLGSLAGSAHSYRIATAQHNLANALLFGDDVTRDQLAEGRELSIAASAIRTLERNARHCWETSVNVGLALTDALRAGRFHVLPLSPEESIAEARTWLKRAVVAARVIGPGEELVRAAFALCELALFERHGGTLIEQAEAAWKLVLEAAPFLLLDRGSREYEALLALRIAVSLAHRLAEESLAVSAPGLQFVLQGESSRLVERWVVRGQQPGGRPLMARMSPPKGVSAGSWQRWRKALDSADQRQIADGLENLRTSCPTFLREEVVNESTWQWLDTRAGSVAIAVLETEFLFLALVMQSTEGNRRTWVLGLDVSSPPFPLEQLRERVEQADFEGAPAAIEPIAAWVRQNMIEPIVPLAVGDLVRDSRCDHDFVPATRTTCIARASPFHATSAGGSRSWTPGARRSWT
jgi:hypothetical protein